jgi:large subunit ribosomal protein L29
VKPGKIREWTDEELEQQREENKRELFNLRIQQGSGSVEQPSRIRLLRRDIARIETERSTRRRKRRET